MASILGKFFGASESADSNDQGTERSEEEFLGEEECLEEEQYKNLEPIFPKLHKKGDPTPRPTIRRCDWKVGAPKLAEASCPNDDANRTLTTPETNRSRNSQSMAKSTLMLQSSTVPSL